MVLWALKKSKCQLIRFFAMALYNFQLLGTIQGVRKIVRVRMALKTVRRVRRNTSCLSLLVTAFLSSPTQQSRRPLPVCDSLY